jgi:hypothetical protein
MIIMLILILCLILNVYLGIRNKDLGNYGTSNANWFAAGFVKAAIIHTILSMMS